MSISASALIRCYSCQYGGTPDTYECINKPWRYSFGAPVVPCKDHLCYTSKSVVIGMCYFLKQDHFQKTEDLRVMTGNI